MLEYRNTRPASVIGPLGEILTLESLPPGNTSRWVARRKAEVVAAVDGGLLSIDEVLLRYRLSLEEFVSWRRALDRAGIAGLKVSSTQREREMRRRYHHDRPEAQFYRDRPAPQFHRDAPSPDHRRIGFAAEPDRERHVSQPVLHLV
jgi:hypothetical protein